MANKYIVRDTAGDLHMMKMEDVWYRNTKGDNLQVLEQVVFQSIQQPAEVQYGPDTVISLVRTDADTEYVVFANNSISSVDHSARMRYNVSKLKRKCNAKQN